MRIWIHEHLLSPLDGRALGMDDEGSGTVGVLGVLRALLTYPRIKSGQAEDTRDF